MTTLAQFLPQVQSLTDHEAKSFGLVLPQAAYDAILAAQAQRPDACHRAAPVATTDGRWILCADLLREVGPGGLYHDGFELLPPALFASVTVIPWDEAVALLPVAEPLGMEDAP
jgi:hypothetical protein